MRWQEGGRVGKGRRLLIAGIINEPSMDNSGNGSSGPWERDAGKLKNGSQ